MLISDFIRSFLVVTLIIFMSSNMITPLILILFTLLVSTVEAFRVPAGLSLLPQLLDEKTYDKGIGLNSTASTLAVLLGTAVSGIIVVKLGYMFAMLIDAISFILSAIIICMIKEPETNNEKKNAKKMNVGSYVNLLVEGFKYTFKATPHKEKVV